MQTIYGLNIKTIENIKAVLLSFPDVQKALLYGSRAKGNFKIGSDIDISLVGEKLNLKILNKISDSLDNLFLPQKFDLSIYHQIENQDLLDHIQRNGIILINKS
jgi:predicted nucleotidyltransferase